MSVSETGTEEAKTKAAAASATGARACEFESEPLNTSPSCRSVFNVHEGLKAEVGKVKLGHVGSVLVGKHRLCVQGVEQSVGGRRVASDALFSAGRDLESTQTPFPKNPRAA